MKRHSFTIVVLVAANCFLLSANNLRAFRRFSVLMLLHYHRSYDSICWYKYRCNE